jgi:hypothetical protein
MTAKEHNRLVGIFLMAHGAMQALVMLLLGIIYGVLGAAMIIGAPNEGKFVGLIFIMVVIFMLIFATAFAGSQIIGGYNLFKEKANARTWGIIGSIVSCISFPLGTAAGVYGLWFLFGDEGKRFYLGGASQPPPLQAQNYQPPTPGAWQ